MHPNVQYCTVQLSFLILLLHWVLHRFLCLFLLPCVTVSYLFYYYHACVPFSVFCYYLVWPFPIFFIITMHVYRFLFFVITLRDRFLSLLLLPCALFPLFVSSIMCTGYWVCFITLCTVTTVCYYYLVYCYHCLLLVPCVLLPLFVIITLCTAATVRY